VFISETLARHDSLVTGNQDGSILKTVQRIETQVGGGTGSDGGSTGLVKSMADLTAQLSMDIGAMAERIGAMADRIVETEYLIVSVITNQTTAAAGIISQASMPDGKGGTVPMYSGPTPIPLVFDQLIKGSTTGVALQTPTTTAVSATVPPSVNAYGAPLSHYIIAAATNATFTNSVMKEIDALTASGPTSIMAAWSEIVGPNNLNLTPNANTPVYVAVKTLDTASGSVSGLSNSITYTFN
jgi:hypothetical protein